MKSICGICPAGCWVETGVKGGEIVDIRPDTGHALGMICRRGEHAPEIVHSEHRLTTPLKYGIKQIKRIGTIEFSDTQPDRDYWTERGYDWYAAL